MSDIFGGEALTSLQESVGGPLVEGPFNTSCAVGADLSLVVHQVEVDARLGVGGPAALNVFGEMEPGVVVVDGDWIQLGVVVVVLFVFFAGQHAGPETGEQRHWDAEDWVWRRGVVVQDDFPNLGWKPRHWIGGVFFGPVDAKKQGCCLWVACQLEFGHCGPCGLVW